MGSKIRCGRIISRLSGLESHEKRNPKISEIVHGLCRDLS